MTEYETHENQHFRNLDPGELTLAGASFLDCTFENCNFSEASFRSARLSGCRFENCELAMIDLTDASLQDVEFETCRLTGVNFSLLQTGALGISVHFKAADLSFSTFRDLDLSNCSFTGCMLREAELVQCKLAGVDLSGSNFERCALQENDFTDADLRGASNYYLSATSNRVSGLQASLPEALNLIIALGVKFE